MHTSLDGRGRLVLSRCMKSLGFGFAGLDGPGKATPSLVGRDRDLACSGNGGAVFAGSLPLTSCVVLR